MVAGAGEVQVNKWSDEEIEILNQNLTMSELTKKLNRTEGAISYKLRHLRLKRKNVKIIHNLTKHKYYVLWRNIRSRCYNKNDICYKTYGGMGIYMYPEWIDAPNLFIKYLEDNLGDRPDGYSLDRINNKEGYIPNNLKWSSASEQVRNSSMTKLTIDQVTEIRNNYNLFTKNELSEKYNVSIAQISRIINNKSWSEESK